MTMTARLRQSRSLVIALGLIVVIFVIGMIGVPGFGGPPTIKAALLLASFLGIASIGQTIVLILGGIDLSIPFVVGAANVAVAKLYGDGMPFLLALVIGVVAAGLFGSLNALISVKSNVHPLIVTLGMGTALLGLIQVWTNGLPTGGAPSWLTGFVAVGASTGPLPIPPVVVLWVVVSVVVVVILRTSVFGRRVYALGNAPRAAEFALVRKLPIWIAAFAVSGVSAAAAGVLLLGFTGSAFATVGQPYLFLSVGAVVLGGTLVTGGRGGYLGTVLGALTITLITLVLTGLGLNTSVQQVVMGVVLIVIVGLSGREPGVRDRV